MKVVVDTSLLVDKFRGGPAWKRFEKTAAGKSEVYISTVVYFEIFSGESTRGSEKMGEIREFLRQFEKVDITEGIATRAGEMARDYKLDIDLPDFIVAATAIEIGAEVVTLNRKHFAQVPGLRLYSP